MTAKEYLSQATVLKRRIKHVEDRITEIRAEVETPKAIRYDKDMIQSSPSGDAFANYLIRLQKAETKEMMLKTEYLDLYERIRNQILGMGENAIYQDILFLRYLRGDKLLTVADELGYDYDWVRKLHGRALRAFEKKYAPL